MIYLFASCLMALCSLGAVSFCGLIICEHKETDKWFESLANAVMMVIAILLCVTAAVFSFELFKQWYGG